MHRNTTAIWRQAIPTTLDIINPRFYCHIPGSRQPDREDNRAIQPGSTRCAPSAMSERGASMNHLKITRNHK